MSVSSRVQEIDARDMLAELEGEYMIVSMRNGRWRVYEDGGGYRQTSGRTIRRGKVLTDLDGRSVEFAGSESARKWIRQQGKRPGSKRNTTRRTRERIAVRKNIQ